MRERERKGKEDRWSEDHDWAFRVQGGAALVTGGSFITP